MFQTVYPNRWFFWTIAICIMVALGLLWAITDFSISQEYEFTNDELFYSLRAKRKRPVPQQQLGTARTELECTEQGGDWGFFGDTIVRRCNVKTADAGKACSDSETCQGDCVASLSVRDKETLSSGQALFMEGQCSAQTLSLGCNYFVRQGQVKGLLCVD